MPDKNTNELSLKQVVSSIGEWKRYLLRRWPVWLVAGALGAALGFVVAYYSKKQFKADLSFVLQDSQGGGAMSTYSGIASQFGLDLGNNSGNGIFSGDNIIEFLKSR